MQSTTTNIKEIVATLQRSYHKLVRVYSKNLQHDSIEAWDALIAIEAAIIKLLELKTVRSVGGGAESGGPEAERLRAEVRRGKIPPSTLHLRRRFWHSFPPRSASPRQTSSETQHIPLLSEITEEILEASLQKEKSSLLSNSLLTTFDNLDIQYSWQTCFGWIHGRLVDHTEKAVQIAITHKQNKEPRIWLDLPVQAKLTILSKKTNELPS